MTMAKLKRSKNASHVVGLDLDPSHLAAAQVHVNGRIAVERAAVASLRPGILRDGEVTDVNALADALREMWADSGFPKTVRLGIANQRIVVRTLDLPPLTDEKALAAAVRVEAPDHIPMPMDEAVLDFQPVGMVDTPAGPRMRVVVVAVRREMVGRYVDAARSAGLKVEGIDLSAFALVRALAQPDTDGEGILFINIAGLTNVAVASGASCLFTRAAAGGLDLFVHTLAERRGLTIEHARQWLDHVGLEAPVDSIEGDADTVTAARAVLEEGVHQLADAIRNSLNFYRTQQNAVDVRRAVLTGPATTIPGLADKLSHALGMPLEVRLVSHVGEQPADLARLAVAAGLAVEAV